MRHSLAVVRLIKAKEVSRHVLVPEGSSLNITGPLASVVGAIGMEHRHELIPRVEVAVLARVPIVGLEIGELIEIGSRAPYLPK